MGKVSLFTILATCVASVSAQSTSSTIPAGFDTTRGDAAVFAGFDVRTSATSTATYNPSIAIYAYDKTLIPANLANKPITQVSFRRDATFISGSTTAHTKDIFMRMSSRSTSAGDFDINGFDSNHGANVVDVFGTATAPKTVSFPATAAPGTGLTAPWNVVIKLDRAFLLRAGQTLNVEYRTYKTSIGSGVAARFRADGKIYPSSKYNGGTFALLNTEHCLAPRTFYTSRILDTGSTTGVIWRTGRKAGLPGIAFIGAKFPTPITVKGTGDSSANPVIPPCRLLVSPDIFSAPALTEAGAGAFYFTWGQIPNQAAFVGIKLAHQAVFFDPAANSIGIAFTRALEQSVGTAYDAAETLVSAVYSYGGNTVRYTGSVDPNNEPHPRYFYRRAPILKIN